MGHTTVKSSVSTPIYIGYRCSKCNHLNLGITNIVETRETIRHGTIHRESTINEMADTANEFAQNALGRRTKRILEERQMGVYRSAELNYACANCGHKEAWSKMRYSKIEEILGFPFLVGIFFAILLLLDKSFLEFILILAGLSSWFVFKHFHRAAMEKRISQLPKHSLPTICLSKDELISQMNSHVAETEKARPSASDVCKTPESMCFCKKCGKKVDADSVFCSFCGARLR